MKLSQKPDVLEKSRRFKSVTKMGPQKLIFDYKLLLTSEMYC